MASNNVNQFNLVAQAGSAAEPTWSWMDPTTWPSAIMGNTRPAVNKAAEATRDGAAVVGAVGGTTQGAAARSAAYEGGGAPFDGLAGFMKVAVNFIEAFSSALADPRSTGSILGFLKAFTDYYKAPLEQNTDKMANGLGAPDGARVGNIYNPVTIPRALENVQPLSPNFRNVAPRPEEVTPPAPTAAPRPTVEQVFEY